jgi:hypothetical protein
VGDIVNGFKVSNITWEVWILMCRSTYPSFQSA